jgi:hypothetical protein
LWRAGRWPGTHGHAGAGGVPTPRRALPEGPGRLADPELGAAADDARELAERLTRGQGRLFSLGIYVTARGTDADEAAAETARLRALLDSLMLQAVPTTWRALQTSFKVIPRRRSTH